MHSLGGVNKISFEILQLTARGRGLLIVDRWNVAPTKETLWNKTESYWMAVVSDNI